MERQRRNSILAYHPETEMKQEKGVKSAQYCYAVDETRLGCEEAVCEDERDVLEEPDLMRASACCKWGIVSINGTSSVPRRDLRVESLVRRDFFLGWSSSRMDDLALGPPVERKIGLVRSRKSSTKSASGITPCCCACFIFIASFEGFEGVGEDTDLLTGGFCGELDFCRDWVDVVETGEGVDLDSSVGGNEGGRPDMPRAIRLPKDWYEVVIAVVAADPFPIGVTNLVRILCSCASSRRDRRAVADGGRTQVTMVSPFCFCFAFDCCREVGRGVSVAVDDPSSVDLPDDRSGSPSDLAVSLSKRSCSIAVSTARRIWEETEVRASEGANSEPRERREAGDGRRIG